MSSKDFLWNRVFVSSWRQGVRWFLDSEDISRFDHGRGRVLRRNIKYLFVCWNSAKLAAGESYRSGFSFLILFRQVFIFVKPCVFYSIGNNVVIQSLRQCGQCTFISSSDVVLSDEDSSFFQCFKEYKAEWPRRYWSWCPGSLLDFLSDSHY